MSTNILPISYHTSHESATTISFLTYNIFGETTSYKSGSAPYLIDYIVHFLFDIFNKFKSIISYAFVYVAHFRISHFSEVRAQLNEIIKRRTLKTHVCYFVFQKRDLISTRYATFIQEL